MIKIHERHGADKAQYHIYDAHYVMHFRKFPRFGESLGHGQDDLLLNALAVSRSSHFEEEVGVSYQGVASYNLDQVDHD